MTDYTTIPLKVCTKCHRLLPATTFFFHIHKTGRNGLRPDCKICHYEASRKRVESNREATAQYQKEYRESHKEKQIEYDRLRYQANSDKIKARTRQYEIDNKDKVAERKRAYRLAHIDHIKKHRRQYTRQNRAKLREYGRKRRAEGKINVEKSRISTHRRLARKRSLPDTLTHEQWTTCLDYFNGCCAVCGRQLKDLFGTHTVAIDHWTPLAAEDCPGTVATNIVPLCHGENGCNNSKGSKAPDIWLTEKYGKRKAQEILARIQAYFASVS